MLNVRRRIMAGLPTVTLALMLVPAIAVAADSSTRKAAPTLDLNAKMQQKLNAKLNGQLNAPEKSSSSALDTDLSKRVDEKSAEVNEQLDEQAKSLTAADRGEEKKAEEAQQEGATD